MEPELILFKRFDDIALANALTDVLDANGITYTMEENAQSFDPGFRSNELTRQYSVKIDAGDFERVTKLLNENELENVNNADKEHYLYSFTDAELIEVLAKADEWSPFDYQLARKILTERGVTINEKMLADLKKERLEELKTPEPPQNGWIIVGYIFAIMGGALGIFIGWYLVTFKKTLPDGERVYAYNENDRQQGKWILYIAIAVTVIIVVYRISQVFTGN
ncbi:hypothetical protein [Mucilaginibacter dorajii]|uniref:DUF2007 domain-containing protein n=1 Tax=Mucilaginibacter dorajii TaxID=692994 RepID=A0ABP7PWC7_9SPHI|nr:hypothetical protein [Mucilaginibacter dorajii]MCS3734883.1 hypothetical protein [Mucilaginibacter dorajii]